MSSSTVHRDRFQSMVSIVDRLLHMDSVADVAQAVADGFVKIGAFAALIFVRESKAEEDVLRVKAYSPRERLEGLVHLALGIAPQELAIPLADEENPYVQVVTSGESIVLPDSEAVLAHVVRTYDVPDGRLAALREALQGRSGVDLPLSSGNEHLGVAAVNFAGDLTPEDLLLFDIFAQAAGSMLGFKRELLSREKLVSEVERALAQEKKVRADLNRAERLAALGEMAAVVAHEIRNPLAVFKNSLAGLRSHLDGSDDAKLLHGILHEETDRIERIIGDMLALSQPDGGRRERVDLVPLLDRAAFLAAEQCGDRLTVVCTADDLAVEMEGDAHSLVQALVNLLLNAYQASDAAAAAVEVRATLRQHRETGEMAIAIADRGRGMDAETLARACQPFFTTRARGTGLGLAIVKRVADAHHGAFELESAPGCGTVARLRFPSRPPD